MRLIATPVSSLFSSKKNIKIIEKYSDCFEGRENTKTKNDKSIKLIHFDFDIHKKFQVKNKIEILKIIKNKTLNLVTFQLSSDYYNPVLINNKFYPKGQKIPLTNVYNNINYNLIWLKKQLNSECKIAIENNNFYKTGAYNLVTNPIFLKKILKKFDLLFLFDYSHAKISAFNLNTTFYKYISNLPLSKIIQVHFCGYEIINHEAVDTHILPKKIDYMELKKLLNKYRKITYITLEYYKDVNSLIKSLKTIRKIIA